MAENNKSILIVDDEEIVRVLLNRFLSKQEFQVCSCTNGLEALSLMKKQDFSLIISDINMPEMDGLELLKNIKKEYRRKKVVLMSGRDVSRKELSLLGAIDFWEKPFTNSNILLSKINHLLLNERRSVNRLMLELPIVINNNIKATTVNISADGLLVKTAEVPPKKNKMQISLGEENDNSAIAATMIDAQKENDLNYLAMEFSESIGHQLKEKIFNNGNGQLKPHF